ncbi:MAG: hypothetical protein JNM07_14270 [Phycisphaerae bacterium]|nr:hypothetical protein [Phycisphaerae bacterium]
MAYLDLAYNIAVIIIACKFWLMAESWKTEPFGLFNSGAPIGRLPKTPKANEAAAHA